jgi:hypothetical protein
MSQAGHDFKPSAVSCCQGPVEAAFRLFGTYVGAPFPVSMDALPEHLCRGSSSRSLPFSSSPGVSDVLHALLPDGGPANDDSGIDVSEDVL